MDLKRLLTAYLRSTSSFIFLFVDGLFEEHIKFHFPYRAQFVKSLIDGVGQWISTTKKLTQNFL